MIIIIIISIFQSGDFMLFEKLSNIPWSLGLPNGIQRPLQSSLTHLPLHFRSLGQQSALTRLIKRSGRRGNVIIFILSSVA